MGILQFELVLVLWSGTVGQLQVAFLHLPTARSRFGQCAMANRASGKPCLVSCQAEKEREVGEDNKARVLRKHRWARRAIMCALVVKFRVAGAEGQVQGRAFMAEKQPPNCPTSAASENDYRHRS